MASKSELSTFQQNWQQTAAWAQSKGIKYNDYYPIYQQDSQRLLQYGSNATMSVAERERAIQAAANPNQAFQSTPSTAANPWNIIHNTITDARNVFTGLGDIVIHPLHNGLVDSVKNTFDLIDGSHKPKGTPCPPRWRICWAPLSCRGYLELLMSANWCKPISLSTPSR